MVGAVDDAARTPARARGRSARAGSRGGRTAGGTPARASRRAGSRPCCVRARGGRRGRGLRRSCSAPTSLPAARALVTVRSMSSTATRTLRGALAGAAAAAVWAVQQPLDRRVFGFPYDDTELLGRLVAPKGAWQAAGVGLHLANGAVFGAVYANVAPVAAGPAGAARAARGARRAPRDLAGDRRSSTACTPRARTCRTCGAPAARSRRAPGATRCSASCSGELERRLNPPEEIALPVDDAVVSTQRARLGRARRHARAGEALSRRVLVTGASGFAGGHLVAACAAAGDEVVALSRSGRRSPAAVVADGGDGPRGLIADLLDPAAARAAVAEAAPDVVFHLAALAHVGRSWGDPATTLAHNQAMTLNVLEAVRAEAPDAVRRRGLLRRGLRPAGGAAGRRGAPRCGRRTRTRSARRPATCSPASTPTRTGCASCARARSTTPGRASRRSTRSPRSRARSRRGSRRATTRSALVTGNPDARRDYTDVRDVVRAYRLLADAGEPGVFNVCSGRSASPRELFAPLARIAGAEIDHASTRRSCARTR